MLKKLSYLFIVPLVVSAVTISCKKDVEDRRANDIDENIVWDSTDSLAFYATQYVNNLYNYLPDGFDRIGGDYLDAATDDALPSRNSSTISYFTNGNLNALNNPDAFFGKGYEGIRAVNIMLKNVNKISFKVTADQIYAKEKQYWKAEGRFIRAMCYWELLKRYGGVPLIGDTVFALNDDLQLPRNTYEECVDYIVGECDAIKDSLRLDPVDASNWGKVGKAVALALKSRVLLYAASPLYNGGGIEQDEEIRKLNGYLDYKQSRWDSAAKAANELITYAAGKALTLQGEFRDVFTTINPKEVFLANIRAKTTNLEDNHGPIGFASETVISRGYTSPTQELVDAFTDTTGRAISEGGTVYLATDPYAKRDPRLGWTVLYNGRRWMASPGVIETYTGGKDRPGGNAVQTRTGYYARKFMGYFDNPTGTNATYTNQNHNFVIFRLAETLLNYAEAMNELGQTEEAVKQIIKLRQRAKIEASKVATGRYGIKVGITMDEMRTVIRNERRVELAFEEHRFWDLRRWKMAESLLNGELHGIRITKNDDNTFTYATEKVTNIKFAPRLYRMPIPYSEISKNRNMLQNEGW